MFFGKPSELRIVHSHTELSEDAGNFASVPLFSSQDFYLANNSHSPCSATKEIEL